MRFIMLFQQNFSNIYLKAKYNRSNTYPKDKYTDPKAEYNNTEPKAEYNRFNTYQKDKDNQFENNFNFNDLLERKQLVNSSACKKAPSKHSSDGVAGGFGCFGNCCNC